jgi:hypothetical protein
MGRSTEDLERQKQIQAQFGDDCAFFAGPRGLIAIAPPERAAEIYWAVRRDLASDKLDQTGVLTRLALDCAVHPAKTELQGVLARLPALGVKLGYACRRLLGDQVLEVDPALDPASTDYATLQELRAKHDSLSWYVVPDFGLVVLGTPKAAAYRQFFSATADDLDDEKPEEVFPVFALDCVVHPARERVEDLFRRKPGHAVRFANRGQGLAGGDIEELGKI